MGSYTQVTTLIKALLVNVPHQRSLKILFLLTSQIFLLQALHQVSDAGVETLTMLPLQERFTHRIKEVGQGGTGFYWNKKLSLP